MTGLQLYLSTVAAVASVSARPHSEHIGGAGLQALHCHHVGFGFQNRVVLVSLVLEQKRTTMFKQFTHSKIVLVRFIDREQKTMAHLDSHTVPVGI